MRVAIAGAGNVGRSIARELTDNGHQVLLIEREPKALKTATVANAQWLLADACELASLEEAVTVGDLVRLLTFRHGQANLVEVTLPEDTPVAGRRVGSITWPRDVALVAILREAQVLVPTPDDPLEPSDELLFITAPEMESELHDLLATAPADQSERGASPESSS